MSLKILKLSTALLTAQQVNAKQLKNTYKTVAELTKHE